ncbi:MAG: hypothetical protein R6W85_04940 [Gillisia sp.]
MPLKTMTNISLASALKQFDIALAKVEGYESMMFIIFFHRKEL